MGINNLSTIRSKIAISTFTASCLLATASSTTYYVATNGRDTNRGTIGSPFATLDRASIVASPGDTIYVRRGIYYFTSAQVLRGGTAAKPKVITSPIGERPIIDCSRFTGSTPPIMGTGAGLTIKGIEFRNSKDHGLSFWGASDVTIESCTIRNAYYSGIYFAYSSPNVAKNVTVKGCTLIGNSRVNASRNTTWNPAITADIASNVIFTNNTVYNNYGEGIGVRSSSNCTITSNKVYDCYSVGIYVDASSDSTVDGNFVYATSNIGFYRDGSPMMGICLAREAPTTVYPKPLSNLTISNNILVNNKYAFYYGNWGLAGGMQSVNFTNNTICGTTSYQISVEPSSSHSGNTFSKNIFYQYAARNVAYGFNQSGFSFSNNCWYGGLLSQRIAGSGDIIADPQFVKAGSIVLTDYQLKSGSQVLSSGIGSKAVSSNYLALP